MATASSSDNLQYGYPTPGPQAPTGEDVMNHVFFLTKAQWKAARETNSYDHIIVGSGFCALAFAQRALQKNPHSRILIVERGPFFLPEHFQNLPLPFKSTLGGLSETFPWTMCATTFTGSDGTVRWQHGMVPFFGGRSTLWSAWCPRPNQNEFDGWPQETVMAAEKNYPAAETLLRVRDADQVDRDKSDAELSVVASHRPVYGKLQQKIQTLLHEHGTSIPGVYRTQAAPLASASQKVSGIDFQKFSTPGDLLELAQQQQALHDAGKGARLDIVSECTVELIYQQEAANGERRATALKTSRGVLPINDANLVLAMGTLPPTTLLRNSFPNQEKLGERFSAHFITSIVARVPKADLDPAQEFGDLELGACYIAGTANNSFRQQYHIQLSALWDVNPEKNASTALRYMPDVVATASLAQLESSKGYVVFVCAVLGEIDYENSKTWFLRNEQDSDPTTNSLLRVSENAQDKQTWDAMDEGTFGILEKVLSPQGAAKVEYWHGDPDSGKWQKERPSPEMRRAPALVHESSTLYIGKEDTAPVDLNYKFRGAANVYVTGGGLWPQGGSWNPTLTMVALAQDLADKLNP